MDYKHYDIWLKDPKHYYGHYDIWLKDPKHYYGQDILNSDVGNYFQGRVGIQKQIALLVHEQEL